MIDITTTGPDTPGRATVGSAGFDLRYYGSCDRKLERDYVNYLPTGVYIAIPVGYVGLVFSRSGLASQGWSLCNGVGVIDSDYRGEIQVLLTANSKKAEDIIIRPGDRIAQMIIMPVPDVNFIPVGPGELDYTERGDKGFGSTGVQ